VTFARRSYAEDGAIPTRAQSDLSRANYDLGGSRLEAESRRNNRTAYKTG